MNKTQKCSDCGVDLPPTSETGLCDKCLLKMGLEAIADHPHMRVRCPHCRNPIEFVDEMSLREITCPSCDSRFSLVPDMVTTVTREPVRRLGQFELIEQVGLGGFGVVWKARDTELDRLVAVKVPRRDQVTPANVDQFVREARAAAQLRHPSIVSVHEIGRQEDCVFIVSDFVDGVTLADWLSAHQLTPREAAELCARLAETLHHAHTAGVIHRDVKPTNVMISTSGEPYIMDFGLAKRDAGEITMTADGKILGTPAYMSPEQARGEGHHADARSDIYSLGVMLFEMLTGEKPFRGTSRMLLHQVIHDDAPSPRKLNSSISVDLETICLSCLEKSPSKRYQTAHDLASELNRFLQSKPILARPVSRLERARRWCVRNYVVASLLAILILVLSCGLAGVTWQWMRAEQLRAVADTRFELALGAVDKYFATVSQDTLLRVPGMRPLRKKLLEQSLEFYQEFVADEPNDPSIQVEFCKAHQRLGLIHLDQGHHAESEASYIKAQEIAEGFRISSPHAYQSELVKTLSRLGEVRFHARKYAAAVEVLIQAESLHENSSDKQRQELAVTRGRSLFWLSHAYRELMNSDLASTYATKAIQVITPLASAERSNERYQNTLGSAYHALAMAQEASGADSQALATYKAAIDTRKTFLGLHKPNDEYMHSNLAENLASHAAVAAKLGDLPLAEESMAQSIQLSERLVTEHPSAQMMIRNLARVFDRFLEIRNKREDPQAILEFRSLEVDVWSRIAASNPRYAIFTAKRARALARKGDSNLALEQVTEIIADDETSGPVAIEAAAVFSILSTLDSMANRRKEFETEAVSLLERARKLGEDVSGVVGHEDFQNLSLDGSRIEP